MVRRGKAIFGMTDIKWYKPAGLLCRIALLVAGSAGDPAIRFLALAFYGCIDAIGVKGTFQLILDMRKKHNAETIERTR